MAACAICLNLITERADDVPQGRQQTEERPEGNSSRKRQRTDTPEDNDDGLHLKVTPCGHLFHEKCLKGWFCKGNKTCPNCMALIPRPKSQLKSVFVTATEEETCKRCDDTKKQMEEMTEQRLAEVEENVTELKRIWEIFEKTQRRAAKVEKEKDELRMKLPDLETQLEYYKNAVNAMTEAEPQVKKQIHTLINENNLSRVKLDAAQKELEMAMVGKRKMEEELKFLKEKVELDGDKSNSDKRVDKIIGANLQLQVQLAMEREKADETEEKWKELELRHQLLINDVERVTNCNKEIQERANIMEGQIASFQEVREQLAESESKLQRVREVLNIMQQIMDE